MLTQDYVCIVWANTLLNRHKTRLHNDNSFNASMKVAEIFEDENIRT